MDKLKMETPDMAAENVEKIAALFPSAVTEMRGEDGSIKKGIDFEMLKQLLSPDVVEEGDERYEFTWVGKKQAMAEAARPTTKTLRPVKEDSRNWDTTENLYIEGDNLEVLKILQESYLGKVKMIYIDPPYNTGHDFIYRDNFGISREEWSEKSGELSEDGNRLFENSEGNARFHSDWCSMMFSRILVARNMLSEDGVIFISIGQTEQNNLSQMCDEIFGEINKVGTISRVMKSGGNKGQYFSPNIEYILVYCKSLSHLGCFREPISSELISKVYNQMENCGPKAGQKFRIMGLYQAGLDARPNQRYWIQCPDGSYAIPRGKTFPSNVTQCAKVLPSDGDGVWRWSDTRFTSELKNGNVLFKETTTSSLINEHGQQSKWNIYTKIWLDDRMEAGRVPVDLITKWENRVSSAELKALNIPFGFAKPVELIKYLIGIVDENRNSTILDFFSGSATTAHAVMQLNAEDGGHRKFIMVQLPEPCDEKSEAFKAGYKNICEIGKERIRRAGDKIKAEHPDADLDIGFRVFRVDESNMKNVCYHPEEVTQLMLGETVSNIKEDRTDMDLLYACLLDWGVEINLPHTSTQVAGCTVHNVDNGALAACFDKAVPRAVVEYMANLQPLRAVFRDSAFATDAEKINVTEVFKNLSPDTKVKVI